MANPCAFALTVPATFASVSVIVTPVPLVVSVSPAHVTVAPELTVREA